MKRKTLDFYFEKTFEQRIHSELIYLELNVHAFPLQTLVA